MIMIMKRKNGNVEAEKVYAVKLDMDSTSVTISRYDNENTRELIHNGQTETIDLAEISYIIIDGFRIYDGFIRKKEE